MSNRSAERVVFLLGVFLLCLCHMLGTKEFADRATVGIIAVAVMYIAYEREWK